MVGRGRIVGTTAGSYRKTRMKLKGKFQGRNSVVLEKTDPGIAVEMVD